MAFLLSIPDQLARAKWKVKIRDQERCEPPHVTILWKTDAWRWNLRTRQFMDQVPEPDKVPQQLLNCIESEYDTLCQAWDEMYPNNRVGDAD